MNPEPNLQRLAPPPHPTPSDETAEMRHVKALIAQVYARREGLKRDLESGALPPRAGFAQLEATDRELSALDSHFKQLWDAARAPVHPAARWATDTRFEPGQLDCVTAIMLKILDAKCHMGEAEKNALAAVYDVVKDRPGLALGTDIHGLIAAARHHPDGAIAGQIHAQRVHAEAVIPKPVMKGFKQWLRQSLPMS